MKAWGFIKQHYIFLLIVLAGAIARLLYAGDIPGGLNQDEASIGYETYALLKEGIDRNGMFLPIHFIAWGSGQNALYAYLSMPFVFLFGLEVWTIRIVSLLFGLLAIFLMYRMGEKLFGSKQGAYVTALLTAISPWQMMMSRWALESNIFPTLVLLAVFFLFKSFEHSKWLYGFTITLSLSLYAYGTAYFFVPVFVAGLVVLFMVLKAFPLRLMIGNGVLGVLLAVPIGLFLAVNRWGDSALNLGLFTIPKLTVPRVERVSSAFGGSPGNEWLENFKAFMKMMASQSDGLLWNAAPSFGILYSITTPVIILGLVAGIAYLCKSISAAAMSRTKPSAESKRSISPARFVIALWLIAAVLMTFITDVNINRVNIVFYPVILLAAAGLIWLAGKAKGVFAGALAALIICFGAFLAYYFTDYKDQISPMFYESFGEAIQYASDATEGTVYVTDQVNMPYIYVLFYERIAPSEFLETVQYANPGAEFQWVQSFGRYVFGGTDLRPGERAAYIIPNGTEMPALDETYMVQRFQHYTVVVAT